MPVVGRDDDDEIETRVRRHPGFGPDHLGVTSVDPRGIEQEIGAGRPGARRIGRERAGHQLGLAVHDGGEAMHGADQGATAAANHAKTQLPVHADPFFSNAASNARALAVKSSRRTKAAASVAPWIRSMRLSSHSTESGPR